MAVFHSFQGRKSIDVKGTEFDWIRTVKVKLTPLPMKKQNCSLSCKYYFGGSICKLQIFQNISLYLIIKAV